MADLKYTPSENAVDISTAKDGGLYKETIKEGVGNEHPQAGDKVIVHYVGTLLDGSEFDSSRNRNSKFDFTLGKGNVIKGWDVGVATMKKGETAKLICDPEYAYGAAGSPPTIPPNATLMFEVELFEWQAEDLSTNKDGGIQRRVLSAGDGYSSPNEGATVEVHLVGKYKGEIFEDRDVSFELGYGSELGVVPGIEEAIMKFKKGEKSLIMLKAPYAFGNDGKPEYKIPVNADVEYEVTLKDLEKVKESWELDADAKLEQAKLMKQKGTEYFKAGNFGLAAKKYKKISELLEQESSLEGAKLEEKNTLVLTGHLNLAACQLKLEQYIDARASCDSVLEVEANNIKGLFRRGQAFFGLKDFDNARKDYLKVVELDSSNKSAKNQAIICHNNIKQIQDKERKTYKNMFEKFASYDAKHALPEETMSCEEDNNDKEPWKDELSNIEESELPSNTA